MAYDESKKPLQSSPSAYDRRKTIGLLFDRVKSQKFYIILWCFVLAAGITLDVLLLRMVKYFTDDVLVQQDASKIFPAARAIVLTVILIIFSQGIQKGSELLLTNRIGQWLIKDLRQRLFDHLQEMSLDFYESQRTGRIMSWITTDVLRIREFAGKQIPELARGPVALVAYLGILIYTNWELTAVSLIVLPIVVLIVQSAGRRTRKAALRVQSALAEVSGDLQESISAIQVIKSFANEAFEILKFGGVNKAAYSAEMRRAMIEAAVVPILMLVAASGLGILLLYGSWQVSMGMITAGQLVMMIAFLHKTNDEANKLGRAWMALQDTLAAADRIFAFLHVEPSIRDKQDAITLEKCFGKVEFENVSFRYPTGDEVLREINIVAEPGKVIALVGPSGAGKSTIAKLIPRFYDVTKGKVLLDGVDIRDLKIEELRRFLGIVPQETILFHGTVRENIAYGKLDASQEEIENAARDANAHEFIMKLENGYDTVVGEKGVKLSGGQRQRISIARAILKDPKILILDEATSNLDTESEKLVQSALERLMKGRTTFVIAHRLSSIRNADEILVMDGGRIVDRGSHETLFNRPGLYRDLYEVEARGETSSAMF